MKKKHKKVWIEAIEKRMKQLFLATDDCPICDVINGFCDNCPISMFSKEKALIYTCQQYTSNIAKIINKLEDQLKKAKKA